MVQEYLRSSFGVVVAASVTGALLGSWAVGDAFDFYKAQGMRLSAKPAEVRMDPRPGPIVEQVTPRYYPIAAPPSGAYRPAAYNYYYDEEPVRVKEREGWSQPSADEVETPQAAEPGVEEGGPKMVEMPGAVPDGASDHSGA